MAGGAGGFLRREEGGAVGGVGAGVQEAFPDDLHGRGGGVDEVVGVEAVVAEFVQQDLVRREILCAKGIAVQHLLKGQVQGRFGQGVGVGAFAEVPDGGDGEEELLVGVRRHEAVQQRRAGVHGQEFVREFAGGPLEAVGHHRLPGAFQRARQSPMSASISLS